MAIQPAGRGRKRQDAHDALRRLPEKKFHRDFMDAGVKIHSTILFSGWMAPGKYDYSATDKALADLFAAAGESALYIPRIKLDVPPAWCAENPEDTTVYYPGGLSKGEIAELACTPAHDWFGMEYKNGYSTDTKMRGNKDPRPNVRGLIGLQSFSSEKWLRDAGEALRRLIRRIEAANTQKTSSHTTSPTGSVARLLLARLGEKRLPIRRLRHKQPPRILRLGN